MDQGPPHLRRAVVGAIPTAAAVALALALRLRFAVPVPQEWDAVDFVEGVERYSVAEMRPHFPGYPVLIWLGRLAQGATGDAATGLTLVSALLGGLAPAVVAALASRLYDRRGAVTCLAAWLAALAPLPLLSGLVPMSDAAGAFVLLVALFLLLRAWQAGSGWGAAGGALGLALGVRLDYAPFVASLLLAAWLGGPGRKAGVSAAAQAGGRLAAAACGLVLGVAPWLAWQAAAEGPAALVAEGLRFTAGHFLDWGGSVLVEPALAGRAAALLRAFAVDGLGTAGAGAPAWRWLATLLWAAAAAGAPAATARPPGRAAGAFLSITAAPYLLWVAAAQNPDRPRHLLPLVLLALPPLAAGLVETVRRAAGEGLAARRLAAALGALLVVAVGADGVRLARLLALEPSPALALVRAVRAAYPEEGTVIFAWDEARLFDREAPGYTVRIARDLRGFRRELAALPIEPARVLVVSSVLEGWGGSAGDVRLVARFARDPLLGRPAELALYRLEAAR